MLTGLKLTWMPAAYAIAHKVYFGADPDRLTLLGEVTTESAGPATIQRGATYYWRVDEVQPDGSIAAGDTWSFNTGRLVAHWKLDDKAVVIGDNSQKPGRFWNGLIDDGRIYSYSMTAEEVAALSNKE